MTIPSIISLERTCLGYMCVCTRICPRVYVAMCMCVFMYTCVCKRACACLWYYSVCVSLLKYSSLVNSRSYHVQTLAFYITHIWLLSLAFHVYFFLSYFFCAIILLSHTIWVIFPSLYNLQWECTQVLPSLPSKLLVLKYCSCAATN